jgi:diguanylate cyclase (GGDEF)-like protein/PAS domain S-box-containing protein
MKDLNDVVEAVAAEIGLDQGEVQRRKSFLEFTDDDVAVLLQVHDLLKNQEGLSNAFYLHLLDYPELRKFLPDIATVARLRKSLTKYFDGVTAGNYEHDYICNRLRVGVVHQRIGLEPKWYIGAYRKYLSELMPKLWELLHHKPEFFLAAYDAVSKVVSLDMGIALDTYFHAERQMVLQHQSYLEEIIDGMPAGLAVVDNSYNVRSMNRMMQRMLGNLEDGQACMQSMREIISNPLLLEAMSQALLNGEPHHNLIVSVASDANNESERHFEFNIRRTRQAKENLLLLIVQDVTFQLQARIKLQESEEYFRLAFSQAAVGIAHLVSSGRITRVNRKMSEILGYTEDELRTLTIQQITYTEETSRKDVLFEKLLTGEINEYSREKQYIHKDGHSVWVSVAVSKMRDALGYQSYIAVVEDISRRKQAEEKLIHMANHDALTGLPNRLLMQGHLEQAILNTQRTKRQVAVLFIDLDRFKNINDSLGHEAGDQLIMETGWRLSRTLRESDTVSRQGGDEFVIVLPVLSNIEDVGIVAKKILAAVSKPVSLQGQEIFPSASIGISIYPEHGQDVKILLKNADTAMYAAKTAGGNCFHFYRDGMGMKALDHLKLEGALQRALEREEFMLHYQPQVDIRTGEIVGVEALLRWHPRGGTMVNPADFISVAEETGLIVPIGEWVLAAACMQHKAWKNAGFPPVRISVNLSARQFQRQDLATQIAQLLKDQDCTADWLSLEITESIVMENPEVAAETLHRLSEMGVHLAIDDFGTGYSSLSRLKRFPIDTLKIDRSFVRDINTDADDAMIVKSVIALAHNMKLSVIAEGVENANQLDFLSEHGCDQMQGYFFSKPVPAAQIDQFLTDLVKQKSYVEADIPVMLKRA